MVEQFIVFWLLWFIYIMVTFFMDVHEKRTFLMVWILLTITCQNVFLSIYFIDISVSYLVVCVGSIIYYVQAPVTFYKWITTFTTMIAYVSLLIWEKLTPIWYFISPYVMIPFIVTLIISLLARSLFEQISSVLVSITMAQAVFSLLLLNYQLHHEIVERRFFIFLGMIIIFLFFSYLMRQSFYFLKHYLLRKQM